MNILRRHFTYLCGASAAAVLVPAPCAASIIPVVGDGKWIWTKPPIETGYLEPRRYDLSIGIELEGTGNAFQVKATTPAPIQLPEQKIQNVKIEKQGCLAALRPLSEGAGQLILATPQIAKGQRVFATANYQLTLYKQYQKYDRQQFPIEQQYPRKFRNTYLGDGPGMRVRAKEVQELAEQVGGKIEHPWDRAKAFHQWVWKNIRPRIGTYTSVVDAIRTRLGDCEEYAAVFIALCRASDIPARLVWVPNHNWAEFYLSDHEGKGHWIAAHTAGYSWFGWTGAHELVLQKGDKVKIPERFKTERLVSDWLQQRGPRPKVRYTGKLTPIAKEGEDPGPGARVKDAKGAWNVVGDHKMDDYLRDGRKVPQYFRRPDVFGG